MRESPMLGTDEGGMVNTVFRVGVGKCVTAVAEVAGIVVVQQVIVTRFTLRFDGMGEGLEVVDNRGDSEKRSRVGAIGVASPAERGCSEGTAAITILGIPIVAAGGQLGFSTSSTVPALGVPAATMTLCGGVAELPLPSLNQIASPWPSMM